MTKTQNVVTLTKVDPKSQEKVAEVDKLKQKQLEQKREEMLQEQLLQQLQVKPHPERKRSCLMDSNFQQLFSVVDHCSFLDNVSKYLGFQISDLVAFRMVKLKRPVL